MAYSSLCFDYADMSLNPPRVCFSSSISINTLNLPTLHAWGVGTVFYDSKFNKENLHAHMKGIINLVLEM